jgi:hypothetical protein
VVDDESRVEDWRSRLALQRSVDVHAGQAATSRGGKTANRPLRPALSFVREDTHMRTSCSVMKLPSIKRFVCGRCVVDVLC